MGEEGDEYDSDYDDENYERLWPANATHLEDYFGHPFDAGEHRLCTSYSRCPRQDMHHAHTLQIDIASRKMPTSRYFQNSEKISYVKV